jgi:hypothetical protein
MSVDDEGKKPEEQKHGYELAKDLEYQPGECILEIGSERSVGGTSFLGGLGVRFITVDPHPTLYTNYRMTGEQFLANDFRLINNTESLAVKFAYLDGFDWDYGNYDDPRHYENQRVEYSVRGAELNNENSMKSHLDITLLLLPYLTDDAVVVYDDTWREEVETKRGTRKKVVGKGGLAVPRLFLQGFKILEEGETWMALSKNKK